MTQTQKLEAEYEVKLNADKYFDLAKNNVSQYPKQFPEIVKSTQVLEGDGINVGSVVLWNYVLDGTPITAKERITLVDNKNRSITWTIFGGDLMNYFNTFVLKLVSVTPKNERACLAKWRVEFEKKNEDVPNPTSYLEEIGRMCRKLG